MSDSHKTNYTKNMAEREGFEPPGPCGPTVFKTAAIDLSATSPCHRKSSALLGVAVNAKMNMERFLLATPLEIELNVHIVSVGIIEARI